MKTICLYKRHLLVMTEERILNAIAAEGLKTFQPKPRAFLRAASKANGATVHNAATATQAAPA